MSLSALSDSINHLGVRPVYHMILIANMLGYVIADLLQILVALVFSAVVKIPVILSTSLRCSFTLAPSIAGDSTGYSQPVAISILD